MQAYEATAEVTPYGDRQQSPSPSLRTLAAETSHSSQEKWCSAQGMKRPLHCLVVDDEQINRESISDMLHRFGFKTTMAIDGQDAVGKIKKGHFDLVLSDVQMPNMDGISLLQWVNGLKIGLKVIIMSGNHDSQTILQAFRSGALDFLGKPFTAGDLAKTLERNHEKINRVATSPVALTLITQAMHDVRGSLMVASGLARVLKKKDGRSDGKAQHELSSAIFNNLCSTINVTEDFCAQAMMLGEDHYAAEEMLDLDEDVIRPALASLAYQLHRKRVMINRLPGAVKGPLQVKANHLFIRSALRNLFDNAIQASPANDAITYDIRNVGHQYLIRIENRNPAPLAEGTSVAISRKKSNGLGLGLSLAKYFVRHYGGEIWSERQGDKTRFLLALPVPV